MTESTGTKAPLFTLPDESGQPVALEQLLGRGPLVLVFYRGDWCSYCNGQLAAYAQHVDALERLGAAVLAISVDGAPDSARLKSKLALPFPVLSDGDHEVIDRYAGTEQKLREGVAIGKPATFIIDRYGDIVWRHVGEDFADRPLFSEVLAQLERTAQHA